MSKTQDRADMAPEYDFSAGTRGKYAARHAQGVNVVLLESDVQQYFPDSRAVNEALRLLLRVMRTAGEERLARP
jgi:hypothetical protein